MTATHQRIEADLKGILASSYPEIVVKVETWSQDPSRIAVYFTDAKFALLYPLQRYHYLVNLIPADFFTAHLENAVWFELAPGESPEELQFPDLDLINEIKPVVMKCINASGFFDALDDAMCPVSSDVERAACWGDFRNSKPILLRRGFKEQQFFDVFHVLMSMGGYCDCEILYNAVETSRLKAEYWTSRAAGRPPPDPHDTT